MLNLSSGFFPNMDKHHWFRMLVCFAPGMVSGKLAGLFPTLALNVTSSVLLLAGISAYLGWSRIRSRFAAPYDGDQPVGLEPVVDAGEGGGQADAKKLQNLVTLCNGDYEVAMRLVSIEVALAPNLSFGQAIARAHERRVLELK